MAKIWMALAFMMASVESFAPSLPSSHSRSLDSFALAAVNRRRALATAAAALLSLVPTPPAVAEDEPPPKVVPGTPEGEGVTVFKTASGLKYIELSKGDSQVTPKYGQNCIISYTAYMKLPTGQKKKQKFDSAKDFITKHGNGRLIPGLDEGLHTMTVGSTRRLIIPPKLGFIGSGLGPMPTSPFDRRALNGLLDKMIEQQGGNLVYDVTLQKIFTDEADQGYYDDKSLTPEEFEYLQRLLQRTPAATGGA